MPVSKGPNCVGDEMRRFHAGQLHSGKSKKPVTNERQAKAIALSVCGKSKYAEMLESLGYSEEAAAAIAEVYDFISAKEAEADAGDGPLGDIDSTPGKQRGDSGKLKQDAQGSVATFPTVPHSEGPMVKARKGRCPTGTRSVGGGFCKNPKAGSRQYFDIEKGKSCPPGSKGAGRGRCRIDFSEFIEANTGSTACPPKKDPAQKQAEKAQSGTQPTKPQGADVSNESKTPKVQSVEQAAEAERKKQQREECKKMQGN